MPDSTTLTSMAHPSHFATFLGEKPSKVSMSQKPLSATLVHKSTKRIRWTKVKALPIKDDQGKTILSVTVMEDITDLKSTEQRLKDANSRITKLLEQALSVDQVIRVEKNAPRSR